MYTRVNVLSHAPSWFNWNNSAVFSTLPCRSVM